MMKITKKGIKRTLVNVRILGRFIGNYSHFRLRLPAAGKDFRLRNPHYEFRIPHSPFRNKARLLVSIFNIPPIEVFEGREFVQKGQVDLSDRTVPLLSDDDLRLAPIRVVF